MSRRIVISKWMGEAAVQSLRAEFDVWSGRQDAGAFRL